MPGRSASEFSRRPLHEPVCSAVHRAKRPRCRCRKLSTRPPLQPASTPRRCTPNLWPRRSLHADDTPCQPVQYGINQAHSTNGAHVPNSVASSPRGDSPWRTRSLSAASLLVLYRARNASNILPVSRGERISKARRRSRGSIRRTYMPRQYSACSSARRARQPSTMPCRMRARFMCDAMAVQMLT